MSEFVFFVFVGLVAVTTVGLAFVVGKGYIARHKESHESVRTQKNNTALLGVVMPRSFDEQEKK